MTNVFVTAMSRSVSCVITSYLTSCLIIGELYALIFWFRLFFVFYEPTRLSERRPSTFSLTKSQSVTGGSATSSSLSGAPPFPFSTLEGPNYSFWVQRCQVLSGQYFTSGSLISENNIKHLAPKRAHGKLIEKGERSNAMPKIELPVACYENVY